MVSVDTSFLTESQFCPSESRDITRELPARKSNCEAGSPWFASVQYIRFEMTSQARDGAECRREEGYIVTRTMGNRMPCGPDDGPEREFMWKRRIHEAPDEEYCSQK